MKTFCHSKQRTPFLAIAIAIGVACASQNAHAENFQGMDVSVEGKGPALIFIPGLNSGKETFVDTCKQFKANYTCHLLTLPGFAGNAPRKNLDTGFIEPMRDTILAYIKSKKINKPVIMGHSLGGFTALLIAERAPDVPKALVIVDALPFYPAIQNPAAQASTMQTVAENMKKQMLDQPIEQYQKTAEQMVTRGMSIQSARIATLQAWAKSSDRATTAQAMFDMMTIDLRPRLDKIKTPTLVLGAWAAYKDFGSTKASTEQIYQAQYQKLQGVQISMSDIAYHFISWDDPKWLYQQSTRFLSQLAKP